MVRQLAGLCIIMNSDSCTSSPLHSFSTSRRLHTSLTVFHGCLWRVNLKWYANVSSFIWHEIKLGLLAYSKAIWKKCILSWFRCNVRGSYSLEITCCNSHIWEKVALNSDTRFADLFDIILRWNTAIKKERRLEIRRKKQAVSFEFHP